MKLAEHKAMLKEVAYVRSRQVSYKLYAVGTNDPVPENWSAWDEVALVVAASEDMAKKLGGDVRCVEVKLDRTMVLMKSPEVD